MPPRLRASRFVLAAAVAAAFVLSAPFIGYVRSWIRTAFPGQFARIIGAAVAVMAVAAIVAAAARIRERRALRYSAIAASLAVAIAYSVAMATGNPDVDVVQRFHFIEYGVVTFLFYRAWKPLDDGAIFLLPVLAGILVGTGDEWLQWFIPARVGEIADIFLNVIAIGCGLLFSIGADPPRQFTRSLKPGSPARLGRMAAAVVLALGVFVHVVHLGYDVTDDEIGTFKSRYAKPRLEALAVEKVEAWRADPPPMVLHRVSREDQYYTEGVTHVMERNKKWAANDIAAAWRENRILEKYYAPVLATPSYALTSGRWPEEQRADAQTRGGSPGTPPAGYVSAANPSAIYTWPKAMFWAVVAALVVALLGSAWRSGGQERSG